MDRLQTGYVPFGYYLLPKLILCLQCWIEKPYRSEQIGLDYGIFWFVALSGFLLYVPLFFCLRGNLVIDIEKRTHMSWKWNIKDGQAWQHGMDKERAEQDARKQMKVSRQMLAYPIAYGEHAGRSPFLIRLETKSDALPFPSRARRTPVRHAMASIR